VINFVTFAEICGKAIDIRFMFAYAQFHKFALPGEPEVVTMFDPFAHLPRPNKSLIYFGSCIIAGLRLAKFTQVHPGTIPVRNAIDESVELAKEIFCHVYSRVPEKVEKIETCNR
jgi:hypothetical protein